MFNLSSIRYFLEYLLATSWPYLRWPVIIILLIIAGSCLRNLYKAFKRY